MELHGILTQLLVGILVHLVSGILFLIVLLTMVHLFTLTDLHLFSVASLAHGFMSFVSVSSQDALFVGVSQVVTSSSLHLGKSSVTFLYIPMLKHLVSYFTLHFFLKPLKIF